MSRWRVSMHGGHSGTYCDHAVSSLREVVEAAVAAGMVSYGLSEHAPRLGARYLYPEEVRRGWTVETTNALFRAYFAEARALQEEFADRIRLWVGFESEVVPSEGWLEVMEGWKQAYRPDFVVGSVHHLDDRSLDGPREEFRRSVDTLGGLERAALAYYAAVSDMVERLRPDVVAHLDLVRRNGVMLGDVETRAVRDVVGDLLERMASMGDDAPVIDVNLAGWRKGLGGPYPSRWIVRRASALGLRFVFGDDSHGPQEVGARLDEGRAYLASCGVRCVHEMVAPGRWAEAPF